MPLEEKKTVRRKVKDFIKSTKLITHKLVERIRPQIRTLDKSIIDFPLKWGRCNCVYGESATVQWQINPIMRSIVAARNLMQGCLCFLYPFSHYSSVCVTCIMKSYWSILYTLGYISPICFNKKKIFEY